MAAICTKALTVFFSTPQSGLHPNPAYAGNSYGASHTPSPHTGSFHLLTIAYFSHEVTSVSSPVYFGKLSSMNFEAPFVCSYCTSGLCCTNRKPTYAINMTAHKTAFSPSRYLLTSVMDSKRIDSCTSSMVQFSSASALSPSVMSLRAKARFDATPSAARCCLAIARREDCDFLFDSAPPTLTRGITNNY